MLAILYEDENSKTIPIYKPIRKQIEPPVINSVSIARHTLKQITFVFTTLRLSFLEIVFQQRNFTASNRHKQNSRFCKEIREDNFRFWWRRVHEDASQGMYMSKIEIFFFTARILQNQRMLCCGECFHDQKHAQFIVVYEV